MWKNISVPGYSSYKVSEKGIIKNKNGHVIKPQLNKHNGYMQVVLHDGTNSKMFLVHRLVASLFIPNPNNYNEVNHIDENKTNNNVTNLEWCNRKYNINYGKHNLHVSQTKKNKDNKTKIPIIMQHKNGTTHKFMSLRQASEECGLSRSLISRRLVTKEPLMGYVFYYADNNRVADNFNTRKEKIKSEKK